MKTFLTQMTKFYIVGGIGIFVNLGILYFFTEFIGLWYLMSAILGIAVSITTNFIGNKLWTFKGRKDKKSLLFQYGKYWLVNIVGASLQLFFLYVLVEFFLIWYILSQIIAIVIASFFNFIFSKYWAFKEPN